MEKFNANRAAFHQSQRSDPARRLASTSRRISNPKVASKVVTLHDPKGQTAVDQKIPKHLKKTLPEPQLSDRRHDTKPASSFLASVRNATCQPKNHVVFLKTHKTASSTILNILYRYGDTHNLTFALPLNRHSQLYYPHFFMSYYVEGVRSRRVAEFHIMCNHMRFRGTEVRNRV